jgi:hypothetical protein
VLQVTGLDARLPLSEASAAGDSAANGSLGTLSA